MFLPPGFNRKKNPSPNLGLLMARLYEFRFSIKCHTFRAVSVELCWLYSPRPSAWPWFILQKYTAGSLCFHQHSFPKNTAAQPGLDSKPITGLWCWIWWVVWCVVSPPIFPSSLSLSVGVTVTISGIWHKRLQQHDVADTGKKPEHFV